MWKLIVMIIPENCPHCRNASHWMGEMKQENPQYQELQIEMMDEQLHQEVTRTLSYY